MHQLSPRTALGLLLAFKCLLRTGELLNVTSKDIIVSTDTSSILVRLGPTKTASRNPSSGTVHIKDVVLGHLSTNWQQTVPWDTPLFPFSSFQISHNFPASGLLLWTSRIEPPYSLRRGGATDMWMSTHSYNIVQHTGRWTSERVMKQHIDDSTRLHFYQACD